MNTKSRNRRKRRAAPGDPRRAVAYVRVSTDKQDLGPQAQHELISRWAQENDVDIVAEHLDHGVSGGAEVESRPGLVAAINDLARLGAGLLLIAKRDRLARDVGIAALIERQVDGHGAKVVAADGNGNGDDAHAALVRGMADLIASHERELGRERTRSALAVKRKKGERTGGIPLGKRLADDRVRLLDDAYELENIEMAIEFRAKGMSYRQVARALDDAKRETRTGKPWDPQQVRRMVLRGREILKARQVLQEERDADRAPDVQDQREVIALLRASGGSAPFKHLLEVIGCSKTLLERIIRDLAADGRIEVRRDATGLVLSLVRRPR